MNISLTPNRLIVGPAIAPPSTPKEINETNEFIWQILTGHDLATAGLGIGSSLVDVRDVSRLVVYGVEHGDEADGQRYLVASGWFPNQAVADTLRKAYPDRRGIIKEGTPGEGYAPDFSYSGMVQDSSKAAKVLGQPWIPLDRSILDAAKSYEALL